MEVKDVRMGGVVFSMMVMCNAAVILLLQSMVYEDQGFLMHYSIRNMTTIITVESTAIALNIQYKPCMYNSWFTYSRIHVFTYLRTCTKC